jgi:hypothetical protein
MNRRFFFTTATFGAFAIFIAGAIVDVQAQRGAGIGHASAPTHAGQGRPATAGRPETAGRPAGATGKPTTAGKPDTTGRPTIADQLARNHGLATQLAKLFPDGQIPDPGDDFKSLGEFVSAAHVAYNNDNFTFEELTAKMHEGNGMSLGAAIQALDPHADVETEVETAQTQAAEDLKAAGKKK